jgi:hypothetical protein
VCPMFYLIGAEIADQIRPKLGSTENVSGRATVVAGTEFAPPGAGTAKCGVRSGVLFERPERAHGGLEMLRMGVDRL